MRALRQLVFLLIIILPLSLPPAHAADAPLEKITVAQFGKEKFLLYMPLYVAMEEGIFAKNGLDVDLKFAGNDDQIFAAVIGGSAQFGMGDPVFTAISHDKGGPGKVVAMMITKLPLGGVTNKDKVPRIDKPEDLGGLRVSSFPEPSTTYTILTELKRTHNLDLSIVQAPFGGQIPLLETDKVDIAFDIEPTVSVTEDKGYRVVANLADWADPQAITGVTTTEDYIKSHPETVQKVVASLQQAVDLIYSSPQTSYDVGKKLYPNLSEKVIKAAVDRMLAMDIYPRSVSVAGDLWQRSLKTRLDSGELKKPQATEVAVDNSFALKAQK
ncbi:MAG: ABC transporter substrate-binding protein [Alphaproteobacteria bacterium]